MAELDKKVKFALDEARILVLGAQVLLGFQYRAFMEPGFEALPPAIQAIKFAGLCLLLLTLALVLLPAARHRIVEQGNESTRLISFTMRSVCCALIPFALALGIDFFIAGERLQGRLFGIASGAAATALLLGLWYLVPHANRAGRAPPDQEDLVANPKLDQRIAHVLTEGRVVLPGAQALLGFQFAMLLMETFGKLPRSAQALHFVSLCFTGITTALLMAPAAWHRIAERGEVTPRFERFASGMVLAALAALAVALSLELAVVTTRWTGSLQVALGAGGICLAFLSALWFGLTSALRARAPALRERRAL